MNTSASQVLIDYVSSLVDHDTQRVATTLADDLMFVSATRILDKQQFIAMLNALYAGFPDWNHGYDDIENRGDGNYAIKWHQTGTHTGTWTMPGMEPIAPTGKHVQIPPQYFFYRVANNKLVLIFTEPMVGGAPRGILEQIGVEAPPL
ncbi:MAG: ester cyclase [Betaproteobacteria bacterium]|nr:MAG: ester cyclase [Betaproteobacteria bacterium]